MLKRIAILLGISDTLESSVPAVAPKRARIRCSMPTGARSRHRAPGAVFGSRSVDGRRGSISYWPRRRVGGASAGRFWESSLTSSNARTTAKSRESRPDCVHARFGNMPRASPIVALWFQARSELWSPALNPGFGSRPCFSPGTRPEPSELREALPMTETRSYDSAPTHRTQNPVRALSRLGRTMGALSVGLALFSLADCRPQSDDTGGGFPRAETFYQAGRQWGEPSSFNPLLSNPDWPVGAMNLIYETLLMYNSLTGKMEPLLAESYEARGRQRRSDTEPGRALERRQARHGVGRDVHLRARQKVQEPQHRSHLAISGLGQSLRRQRP